MTGETAAPRFPRRTPEGKFLVTIRVERGDGQFVNVSQYVPDDLLAAGDEEFGMRDWAVREVEVAFVSAYRRVAELPG